MSAPAFAALLGLDVALSLTLLVFTVALTPLAAPFFVALYLGAKVQVSPIELGVKLFMLLAGAAAAAAIFRRLAGAAWVERQRERIDGLNVIVLFIFAIALMEEVSARIFTEPLVVFGLLGLSFIISLGIVGATMLVFRPAGLARAFAIGLAAGHRNMGLMLAATGGALPDLTWLYFALAQFPIYLLPYFLSPLARRLISPPPPAGPTT
jgi:BASS family bile acid:Na+ symporter